MHDVHAFGNFSEGGFDFVGDVRDDLDGFAEIIAAALFGEDGFVDAAGGPVVVAGQLGVGEALVVAEVEIGFRAVFGDEHFAVLKRTHRAGIDVQVGIALLEGDFEAATFEQAADGGRCYAFSERGNHAAGNKNIFRGGPQGPSTSSRRICVQNIMVGNAASVKLRFSIRGNYISLRLNAEECRDLDADLDIASTSSRTDRFRSAQFCAGAQELFHALDVGGHVHADRIVFRFDHVNAETIFEPAQLLELLDALQFAGRQRGKFQQRVAAITVEADVFPMAARRPSRRYREPTESARAKNRARCRRNPARLLLRSGP